MVCKFFSKHLLLATIACCCSLVSFAQFEEGKQDIRFGLPRMAGTSLNDTPHPADTLIYAGDGAINRTIKNIVTFKINEDTAMYYASDFTATINFTVKSKDVLANAFVTTTHSLTVNYDSATGAKYNVRAYLILPQSEEVIVQVDTVIITGATGWDPMPLLELENEMRALRYYNLSANTLHLTPSFDTPVDNTDALAVSWTWDTATHNNMSQLEWAWVNKESAGYYPDTSSIFIQNSTRVDLDYVQNSFSIPLLYDSGKIYYRVRAALRKNNGSVITGPWSSAQVYDFAGHERNLNWQSSTAFAEDGKFKTVIQYFDGSLRSRQTVTKDNTTGNIIVGETIYDLQGRPNVQVLPTPTADNTIQYFDNFNKFNGQSLNDDPAKYFDLTPADVQCSSAPSLDSTYGNAKYYSSQNPWLGTEAKASYIPDAQGYAYTETRFMDDATERVRSQGGVGINHQIGSGHETRYYYGKPGQQEMDALFGTEAGDASHYSKNMVQDANGQMSISYVDMHGRTIATALAGTAPESMDSILNDTDYPQATGYLTNQLLTPVTNIINGNTIEAVSSILVPVPNDYLFTYALDPAIFQQLDCNSHQVCFDCKYDLEISIKSEECGDTAPIIKRFNNLRIISADSACTWSMGFTGTDQTTPVKEIDFTQTLGKGSYIIRKTLTLNDSLFRVRRDSALKVFLCKTQQSLYDSVVTILYSTSGCGLPAGSTTECDSCKNKLGTFTFYRNKYLIAAGYSTRDSSLDSVIHIQYRTDSLACVQACSLSPQLATLAGLRNQLLGDMVPYSGQYALDSIRNATTGVATAIRSDSAESKYNIFTTLPSTAYAKPFYRHPRSEAGDSTLYFTEDNVFDPNIYPAGAADHSLLYNISRDDYAMLFQRSWANSLIIYHPEYSKLHIAETTLRTSYEWLDKVSACTTYQMAVDSNYINPLSSDPYFVNNYIPADNTHMGTYLTDSIGTAAGAPSIWQLANGMVLCTGLADPSACMAGKSKTGIQSGTTTAQKDRIWEQFRSIYLSYRNEMVLGYINSRTGVLSRNGMDSLLAENKQLAFANQQDLATEGGYGTWWHNITTTGDTTGIGTYTDTTFNTDKCLAQKPFWKARLLQCDQLMALLNNQTSGDSTTVNNIVTAILDSMVMVCHLSIDSLNPAGASNVNPVYAGAPQNFEDIINHVFTANGIHTSPGDHYFCNPYSIDYPKPYGSNTPVSIRYSNVLDSCGCAAFAALKLEAGADSASMATMNSYLLANYGDTLTTVLWNGLQQCAAHTKDTCFFQLGIATNEFGGARSHVVIRDTCGTVTFSAAYINTTSTNNMAIVYSIPATYTADTLFVYDSFGTLVYTRVINRANTTDTFSIPGCTAYQLTLRCYSSTCHTQEVTVNVTKPKECSTCVRGLIDSAVLIPPVIIEDSERIVIHYTTPVGAANCRIMIYTGHLFGPLYTYYDSIPVSCSGSVDTLMLPACYKYYFSLVTDLESPCYTVTSDTVPVTQCYQWVCTRSFTPIVLDDVTPMPLFLGCGYQRPCLTCGRLDSLTAEFHAIFTAYSSVPYLDSTLTDAQQKENSLWARFLNYRIGYSNTTAAYLQAYAGCRLEIHGPIALCSIVRPLNDPGDMYPVDTLPCRYVQTQAQFIAQLLYTQMKDSLISRFDSLYTAKCMAAKNTEQFYVQYMPKEYHYTLYYYDQAGNLVKTLPPAAVKPNFDAAYFTNVAAARAAGTFLANGTNNESLGTNYRYNSLNQAITQHTPDAGSAAFWYDRLGRLSISQNAKQYGESNYSYTLYDSLGRITEVGQRPQATAMSQTISQDTAALRSWIADNSSGVKAQITGTIYDTAYTPLQTTLVNGLSGLYQQNLRNRVSYSYIKNTDDNSYTWDAATFYTYDIHGNVDTLLQDFNTGMGSIACSYDTIKSNRFKKLVYSYDLISGKVNDVAYQPGQADQFYHHYSYDAENRLTEVSVSRDKLYWEKDATYDYYRHGPLARMVLGQNMVQGIDYAYTVQGWLKGVNSSSLGDDGSGSGTLYDMGNDGSTTGDHALVSKDAFGYNLHYFSGDYMPIGSIDPHLSLLNPFADVDATPAADLYNGNIKAMAVNIPKLGEAYLYGYRYDQLNRLTAMDPFIGLDPLTNTWNLGGTDYYTERISYDPNGNITHYSRNGKSITSGHNEMDDLTYNYTANTNKLRQVNDNIPSGRFSEDIDDQADADNYTYDAIGNMVGDISEGIDSIKWTVYGKIARIVKSNGTTINYTYNAGGNRISKLVNDGSTTTATYYVRDATGNVMSVYSNTDTLRQTELDLYGSSRLGIYNVYKNMQDCAANTDTIVNFIRGNKFFELTNHLGNVLATISDKKQLAVITTCLLFGVDGNCLVSGPSEVQGYFGADVVTANDYYPFGMAMPGRKYSDGDSYRYGFNGKENDKDISAGGQDYGMRIYDGRLGRFLSVDPLTPKYPELTPYQFASNRPIDGIDEDGLEYSPAGRNGFNQLAIDATAVQHYNMSPQQVVDDKAKAEKSLENRTATHVIQKQTTVGQATPNTRTPEQQALFNKFMNFVAEQQRTQTNRAKLEEKDPMSKAPILGNVSQFFKRLGARDYTGATLSGAWIAFDAVAFGRGSAARSIVEEEVINTGMTDLQLVTRAAGKAETAIGGTGRFAGTAKHTYANNLLSRYQNIYGSRGLQFNQYFNGSAGKGFLDVINHETMTIYDYKFGNAVMGNSQFLKYSNSFPGYEIQIIKP